MTRRMFSLMYVTGIRHINDVLGVQHKEVHVVMNGTNYLAMWETTDFICVLPSSHMCMEYDRNKKEPISHGCMRL